MSNCVGCEEKPAVTDGLCEECTNWCTDFFAKLFPAEDD